MIQGRLSGLIYAIASAFSLALWAPALAQVERQHQAHVHGDANGTLAVDGEQWVLQVDIPGYNIVGFEYAPRSEADRQAIVDAEQQFSEGGWLSFDPNGQCSVSSIQVTTSGYEQESNEEHDHHDHNHGHQNNHHDHDTEHAYFGIEVAGYCSAMDAMSWLDLDVFSAFPNNQRVAVAVLTDTAAFEAILRAGDVRIRLD